VSEGGSLLDPSRLGELGDRLSQLGLDGWLLYDFREQNPVARALIGRGTRTRRAFAYLPREGEPVLLLHPVDQSSAPEWRWARRSYPDAETLPTALRGILGGARSIAMEISPGGALPMVDRVPGGILELVRGVGVGIGTSSQLIGPMLATWSPAQREGHRRAAAHLEQIARGAIEWAGAGVGRGAAIREGELVGWILDRMSRAGIDREAGCLVAGGARAADPHYHPPREGGELLEPESPLLLDLWGACGPGAPADQSWMGYLGTSPSRELLALWEAVRVARDQALDFIRGRVEAGVPIRGWEVDAQARRAIGERGLDPYFLHRLGHSIDGSLHGLGPNLDSFETVDDRPLLAGMGFSVEPGLYLPGVCGLRSEVNVYLLPRGIEVTPPRPQQELLLAGGGG